MCEQTVTTKPREYWRHIASGDVYLIDLSDDGITAVRACGPVDEDTVTLENRDAGYIPDNEDTRADAAWLNNEPIHRLDASEYWSE